MEMEQAAPTYVGAALRRLRDGYSWGSQRRSFALLRTTGARRGPPCGVMIHKTGRKILRAAQDDGRAALAFPSPYGLKAVT